VGALWASIDELSPCDALALPMPTAASNAIAAIVTVNAGRLYWR
jgi:hypothetical protein